MKARIVLAVALALGAHAAATPASAITLDMVTVGNPGNAADTTGFGHVPYEYKIGKFEVTVSQWAEFLNAAAKSDPYGLFNPLMTTQLTSAGIARSGSDGDYVYSVLKNPAGQPSGNRPIAYVSFLQAARFANWLHNGQGSGSTESGAYQLSTGTVIAATRTGGVSTYTTSGPTTLAIGDQVNVSGFTDGGTLGTVFNVTGIVIDFPAPNQFTMANTNGDAVADGVGSFTGVSATHAANAKFWVPTEDEWYKAAYFSPELNGGAGGYYQYATQADSPPGQTMGELANQANWSVSGVYAVGPTPLDQTKNYLADVGSYTGSSGAYGTFDMTGNVKEWTAAITSSSTLGSPGSSRIIRGGAWTDGASRSTSAYQDSTSAHLGFSSLGFRLAAPASLPGDFDADGDVDAADLNGSPLGWNSRFGVDLDGQDFLIWQRQFGGGSLAAINSVPEPASAAVALGAVAVAATFRPRPREATPRR